MNQETYDFVWRGRLIHSFNDLMGAVLLCETEEDAQSLLAAYSTVCENAKQSIGYMAGYCSREQMEKIFRLFDCEHPFLGKVTHLSQEEIFHLGMKMGEDIRKYGSEEAIRRNLKTDPKPPSNSWEKMYYK